jgi:hypothetical protein
MDWFITERTRAARLGIGGRELLAWEDVGGRHTALQRRRVGDRAIGDLALRKRADLVEVLARDDVAGGALFDQALGDEDRHRDARVLDAVPVAVEVRDEDHRRQRSRHDAHCNGPSPGG